MGSATKYFVSEEMCYITEKVALLNENVVSAYCTAFCQQFSPDLDLYLPVFSACHYSFLLVTQFSLLLLSPSLSQHPRLNSLSIQLPKLFLSLEIKKESFNNSL